MASDELEIARANAAARLAAEKAAAAASVHYANRQNTISKREVGFKRVGAEAERYKGLAQNLNAKTAAFSEARNTARWLWPVISGVVVVFVLVGPGLAAAMKLLSSITWWYWPIIIVAGLFLWRNR